MSALKLPTIATCSYKAYRREMGALVRVTLYPPRFIHLPDPRWSDRSRLPYISELAPRKSYWSAPADEFDRAYLAQLAQFADTIAEKLCAIPPENGRLVLACFEQQAGPGDCHRRLFGRWAEQRWSIEVPELDPAL